jgi:DNA-binding SARP family transcriptional activator
MAELASTVKRMCGSLDEVAQSLRDMGVDDTANWVTHIASTLREAVDTDVKAKATHPELAGALDEVRERLSRLNPNDTFDRRRLADIAAGMRKLREGMTGDSEDK